MSSISSSLPQTGATVSTSSNEVLKKGSMNLVSSSSSSTAATTIPTFQFEYVTPEMAYFGYMEVSREAIRECVIRCRCWSSVYDKCKVSKEMLQMQEQKRKTTKSLEMEDLNSVEVHVTTEEEGSSVGMDNDDLKSGHFRSRATTLASAKIARTASLRAHDKLHSRRAMVTKSQNIEKDEGETKLVAGMLTYQKSAEDVSKLDLPSSGLRRSGTISASRPRRSPNSSPRTSPKFGRKISSVGQFDDKTGLFLKIVMDKLMDMMEHPPVVNVLMMRLISRLALYPQPLLRSLLLNHQLVLKPGVPNLLSVCTFRKSRFLYALKGGSGFTWVWGVSTQKTITVHVVVTLAR